MKIRSTLLAAIVLTILLATATSAFALTRLEIIGRAQRWVDLEVAYSQVHEFESYRQDCSGMASMAWRLGHSYTSRTLAPHGEVISRDELQPGDMLLEYDYHAAIFYKWANADHTWYWALEQSSSTGHAVERLTKYPYWNHTDFIAYRPRIVTEVNDYAPYLTPIAGADRYATAIAASKLAFPDGSTTQTVICSGANWPDALGGSALAGSVGGPILLVGSNSVPTGLAEELARLGVQEVLLIGGEGAVSKEVAQKIEALPSVSVRRIGGIDRYETAALVASETVTARRAAGLPYDGGVYIATGLTFPDALGAAPVAAHTGRPILLARTNSLPDVTANALRSIDATQVFVAGGTGALDTSVTASLETTSIERLERLAGENRYETSRALAEHGIDEGLAWDNLALATGQNFPDALAGGVVQAQRGSVLVLTATGCLMPGSDYAIREHLDVIDRVTVFGGDGAVSPHARRQIRWIMDEP